MRKMKRIFVFAAMILWTAGLAGQSVLPVQEREVLIIGTMHWVPKIVANSYRPLLKYAVKYAPDAILTEDIMPGDTLSLVNFTPKFYALSDSLSAAKPIDETAFAEAIAKPLTDMSQADFELLRDAFLTKADRANYDYYDYLCKYGVGGSRKPLQNESNDLTHKLAIAMGLRQLLPIDDHHTDAEYNQAWLDAVNSGADNGDLKTYFKLNKKTDRARVLPALLGRLGRFTNRLPILERYYQINSLRYVEHPNEQTELAKSLWDGRNERMAQHIISQLSAADSHRAVLVVGSGHVLSLRNALNALDPSIKVVMVE